jgi:hypothetical protein
VYPAIKANHPKFYSAKMLFVQHDGAGPHTGKDVERRIEEKCNEDWVEGCGHAYVKLVRQPSNSPELNANDLGLNHSLDRVVQRYRRRMRVERFK